MRSKLRTIIALILVLLMVLGIILGSVALPQATAEGSDLQSELEALQKERKEMEEKLSKIENKRESELEKKELIDQQINGLTEEIEIANMQLSEAELSYEKALKNYELAKNEYDIAFEEMKTHIRASYESGTVVSYLEIVLASGSITDFINRVEIVSELFNAQKETLQALESQKAEMETSLETMKAQKEAKQKASDLLIQQESTLNAKKAASESLVEKFSEQSDDLIAQIEEAERLEKEMGEQIRQQLAQEGNGNMQLPVSDGFRYPLDSKWRTVTSPFGYRTHPTTGVYKLHTGVDISGSGISGANIYAAKNGSVSKAGFHRAYGNYAVINHGDGSATLYAHMSSLFVSEGQSVMQGDVLGLVGSTGYSTGAHLHFEIIINGDYVDPIPYFTSVINFIYY